MPTAWLQSQTRRPCVRHSGTRSPRSAFTEITPDAGAAIGQVFNAATAWIMHYWIKRLGREPGGDEIEPLTRAYWEMGRRVSAAEYLGAIEELQRFARRVFSVPRRFRRLVDTDDVESSRGAR